PIPSSPPAMPPTPPPDIYTLSLHDALPICPLCQGKRQADDKGSGRCFFHTAVSIEDEQDNERNNERQKWGLVANDGRDIFIILRSEEHTSELQSRFDLVCRLLLEKKNH